MLSTMNNIQEQSGRAARAWWEQMAVLPQEGVKTINYWMDSIKGTRDEFNSIIRDSCANWGNIFEQTVGNTEATARQSQQKTR